MTTGDAALPPERTEDASLARRIRSGDPQALAQLYDRLAATVNGIARRSLEAASAEEIVQDTFARVWSRISIYSPERGSLAAWVLRIARNLTIDELRRRRHDPVRMEFDWEGLESLPDPNTADPHEETWRRETRTAVRECCAELPDKDREVVFLAYFGGLTQSQIASRLEIPLGTVKTRTRSAMFRLRDALNRKGLV